MNGTTAWSDLPTFVQFVIIVLGLSQLGLQVVALIRLFRTPEERLQTGKRWVWLLIVLLGGLVGTIVFLATGRLPPQAVDPPRSEKSERSAAERGRRAADVLYRNPDEERPVQEQDPSS